MEVLAAVLDRCAIEAEAEADDAVDKCQAEPMLAIVHGLPGAGKSEIIKWLRELFGRLGWSQDVEFMCAAPRNSMAALIGGVSCIKLAAWASICCQEDNPVGSATRRGLGRTHCIQKCNQHGGCSSTKLRTSRSNFLWRSKHRSRTQRALAFAPSPPELIGADVCLVASM